MDASTREIIEKVHSGQLTVDEALLQLKKEPFEDIEYAKVDHHRKIRQGVAEIIYGQGKTSEQIVGIVTSMIKHGQKTILITRIDEEKSQSVIDRLNSFDEDDFIKKQINEGESWYKYYELPQILLIGQLPKPDGKGRIVVATGGTSDIPVAEEAAITAEALGNEVVRLYDVGVAGIHRTLSHMDDIMSANVIVAIAGMEGALASVLGGLCDCPVIAVPTSVGYGASFGGISALLSMLNSCASGVSVVNIDNGFGAGYQASLINHR